MVLGRNLHPKVGLVILITKMFLGYPVSRLEMIHFVFVSIDTLYFLLTKRIINETG